MKQVLGRLVVGLLAFLAGLWWTGVINNPWVMSKYHRGVFIESSFALVAGAICCGLALGSMSKNESGAERARVFTLLKLLSGLTLLFLGMQTFIGILSSGQLTYDSLLDG